MRVTQRDSVRVVNGSASLRPGLCRAFLCASHGDAPMFGFVKKTLLSRGHLSKRGTIARASAIAFPGLACHARIGRTT